MKKNIEKISTKLTKRFITLLQEPTNDPDNDMNHSDWEHYSWKCRFVIVPDKNLDSESIKNEEVVQTLKNDFVHVLMFINELNLEKRVPHQRSSTVSAPQGELVAKPRQTPKTKHFEPIYHKGARKP